jgi:hypothetical protein
MLRAKKNDVLAVGPVFNGDAETVASRRVVLVKHRDEQGDTKEYVIINRPLPAESPAGPSRSRKETTHSFTHAVRMFCDHILEQACYDDWRYDEDELAAAFEPS